MDLCRPRKSWQFTFLFECNGDEVLGEVLVEDGAIKLRPDHPMGELLLELGAEPGLAGDVVELELHSLLISGMARKGTHRALFLGFLVRVGETIDWLHSERHLRHQGGAGDYGKVWRAGVRGVGDDATLTKYWLAGQAHFAEHNLHLSVSPDASRIGRRSVFQSVIATPDNIGMIAEKRLGSLPVWGRQEPLDFGS